MPVTRPVDEVSSIWADTRLIDTAGGRLYNRPGQWAFVPLWLSTDPYGRIQMAETSNSSGEQPAWQGDQTPCVYCGQVIDRSTGRCPHCRTSFSFAVRQASREVVGDWYYLDPRNPSGRGVTFETLIKMIEKGRIKADSVVRGPTTHHDWMYAAEAPRLAKYLGMCPHCFAEAKPEDTFCTSCQLNMNMRPGGPRPGIPPDLAKEPFHKDAYEMEQKLAEAAAGTTEAPAAAPAPTPPPGLAAAPTPRPEPTPTATAAAAAAALADTGTAVADRQSRIVASAARRGRPKLWLVLILTWVTLIPVLLLAYFFIPSIHSGINSMFGAGATPAPPPPDPLPKVDDAWIQNQLAEADKAEQAKDYNLAIAVIKDIIAKTGDVSLQARIEALRRKPEEEHKARLAKLRNRLELAETFSTDHRYDDALAVLRNIGKEDRSWLLSRNVDVDKMEETIRAAQTQYVEQKKQQEQLTAMLTQAADLRKSKKLAEALSVYTQIGNTFPNGLVAAQIDLVATIQQLQTEIAAATPTPPPPPPPPPPPDEAAKAVADMLAAAAGLEKQEKFAEALATLEEIKTKFDQKFWPDALEDRIRQVKAKKEALEFFGIDTPKK